MRRTGRKHFLRVPHADGAPKPDGGFAGRADGHGSMVAAPDFTLPDQSGADWALSEHRDGAVVVVFYRGDW